MLGRRRPEGPGLPGLRCPAYAVSAARTSSVALQAALASAGAAAAWLRALRQTLGVFSPSYLMRVAPLSGVRYCIEARMPTPEIATMLHIEGTQPCLVLRRETLSRGQVESVATPWHPANRYQFTGGF